MRVVAATAARHPDGPPDVRPFDRPADRLLFMLRGNGRDAYRCALAPGSWVATCPLCQGRSLLIQERTFGRNVTISCGTGCDGEDVLAHLEELERRGGPSDAWVLVDDLRDLAWRQQKLLNRLVLRFPEECAA